MSIIKVDSNEWREWGRGEACCFLCGRALQSGEDVILWSGCASSEKVILPFVPYNAQELMMLDNLSKASGGFQPALDIYFHIDCVPSFCRRLLQDWEALRLEGT